MRLNERDSQIATAAVQLVERELADRLEEHPEPTGFAFGVREDERRALDEHDRITQIVRKLSTGGEHELFDWEAEIVRASLTRYRDALSDSASPVQAIADENSQYITSEEQRRVELEHATALLEKFPSARA
jgi:hypothetical protein